MRKFVKATLFALALVLGMNTPTLAELGYKIGANTVDDITTTVCTNGANQSVDMFANSAADMDMVVALQVEVGSKGSGAWIEVPRYGDVFPTASLTTTQIKRYVSSQPACFRLFVTKDSGGTAQFQLVSNRNAAVAWKDLDYQGYVVKFDDFHGSVLGVANLGTNSSDLISFRGDDDSGSAEGDEEPSPEGILTMTSGNDDAVLDDETTVTYGHNDFRTLVSDGTTILEIRVALDTVVSGIFEMSLTEDVSANGLEHVEHILSGTTVTDDGDVDSAVGIIYHTDSTNDEWTAVSTLATAIGNAALTYTLGVAPVVNTYQLLRIEVDSLGHAYFYINGELQGAEPLAVGPADLLMPRVSVGATTTTHQKVDIDYMVFAFTRPSGT